MIDPSGGGPRLFFAKKAKTPTASIPIHLDAALGPFTSSWVVMADPEENGFCVKAAR